MHGHIRPKTESDQIQRVQETSIAEFIFVRTFIIFLKNHSIMESGGSGAKPPRKFLVFFRMNQ